MALTLNDVDKIARLSRLSLNAAEREKAHQDLTAILAMIETMQAVDTTDIEPLSHPIDGVQRLREDVVTETDHRALYLRNAPATQEGLFLVPKVIE